MLYQIFIELLEIAVKQHAYRKCVVMRPHVANHDALDMTCELSYMPSQLPDILRTSRIIYSHCCRPCLM